MTAVATGRGVMGVRDLGLWVKQRRLDLGLSQRQVCEVIKTDPSWLSQWERGSVGTFLPEPSKLAALAEVLEVSVPEMLTVAGYITADGAEPERDPETAVYTSLAEAVDWEQLSDDVKAMIRRDLELARDLSRRKGRE